MTTFLVYFVLSLVILGALTYVGLLSRFSPVGSSRRGRLTTVIAALAAIGWTIASAFLGGVVALAATALAGVCVFAFVFLR